MRILRFVIIIAFLSGAQWGLAQTGNVLTQTRTWKSAVGYNLATTDSLAQEMSFTTVGSDRIEHRDHRNRLQTFDIVSTEGSWLDISSSGSITYHVSINDQHGVVVLERNASGVSLLVDFSDSESGGVKIKYIINAIE